MDVLASLYTFGQILWAIILGAIIIAILRATKRGDDDSQSQPATSKHARKPQAHASADEAATSATELDAVTSSGGDGGAASSSSRSVPTAPDVAPTAAAASAAAAGAVAAAAAPVALQTPKAANSEAAALPVAATAPPPPPPAVVAPVTAAPAASAPQPAVAPTAAAATPAVPAAPATAAPAPAAAAAVPAAATTTVAAAPPVKIVYGSTRGNCKALAEALAERLLAAAAAAPATAATSANACCGGGGAAAAAASSGADAGGCCRQDTGGEAAAAPSAGDCCRQQPASSSPAPAPAPATAVAAAAPFSSVTVIDAAAYEPEQLLTEPRDTLVVLVVSTYEGGTPPPSAGFFCSWLEDAASDFRLGAGALGGLRTAVWGAGNSLYGAHYNAVARRLEAQLLDLGARRFRPLGLGDEDAGDLRTQFATWAEALVAKLVPQEAAAAAAAAGGKAEEAAEEAGEGEEEEEDDAFEYEDEDDEGAGSEVDIEDIGGAGPRRGKKGAAAAAAANGGGGGGGADGGPPEMLNALIRGSLTKQGYKIIGSHSGVKMCRWTKSMLRGRGGCYKHAFYGIESHRCMEATPSLACANKCVFCWRHHSNPVGKTWKWKMDPPDVIVDTALDLHCRMVREYSGVPGVKPEAVAAGLAPRHCALSLVGEPIMYPEINALVGRLHARGLSTFLVTNAQFPDRIQQLSPVTQLYVSVDAATPASLKAVDRPLFADYWERFTACLTALRDKRQRTVYRLTLVKGWNMEEVADYARLVDLGRPDFIEIKGVTYCGSGGASSLTMANVPYHADVVAFGEAICQARGGEYGLACEHAHSCCILLARVDKFKVGGAWHTWIDYDRFQQLAAEGGDFGAEDYMLPTPPWAAFGSEAAGFDPGQVRVKKVRRHPGRTGTDSESVAGPEDVGLEEEP
ncbi:hypothetical protein CHLRE_14g623300v5 [Chlamydomonas reinhardtii]|uniref:tRNA 4-demethylwyosine synthase (AdoMet-dependent) n=1 Tax=Chlamydomonas reinhardtii TaxID=3055 RepID=A0A2K3CY54_CHLRE|nr:uncharacterized protein CHLRE_14g623300v5 [Chlamydomonas reinhardtii]PNW73212.1 hypothetical protein CHLRE_14g623300v5 [Chlamydomonas reinhardtii]